MTAFAYTSTTLRQYLEVYLRREGLYEVIPEDRRSTIFSLPILSIWAIGSWVLAAYFLIAHRGVSGIIPAVVGPIVIFLATMLLLAIVFAVRQIKTRSNITSADAGTIGTVMLIGIPIIMAIWLGIYLASWTTFILYITVYVASLFLLVILQRHAYRVHLFIELIKSVFSALWKSISLIFILIPLLLVVVLFSIFTRDLWLVISALTVPRIIVSMIWLILPAYAIVVTSRNRETKSIIGDFPDNEIILTNVESTPFIKEKLDHGLISEEEWVALRKQLLWRSSTKLAEEILPILRKRVKRWLTLLIVITSLSLLGSFFLYFFILFSALLLPSQIADWTSTNLTTSLISISLFSHTWVFGLPSTTFVTVRVSLILAFIVGTFSSILSISDENIKNKVTRWLREKSASWLSVSALYLCNTSPNYQIWQYIVRNKEKGIANVFIIVPKGLPDGEIRQACEHMETRLTDYKKLVIITAFEQNLDRPIYRLDLPGNRWQLLYNKSKDIRSFEYIPLTLNELRDQTFLGRDSLNNRKPVPDEWFGNSPEGIVMSKLIWESDIQHEWILHPYVFVNDKLLSIDIASSKKKETTQQYHHFIHEIYTLGKQSFPAVETIMIDVYFRDTTDSLARFIWNNNLLYIDYKDEWMRKSRQEKLAKWET